MVNSLISDMEKNTLLQYKIPPSMQMVNDDQPNQTRKQPLRNSEHSSRQLPCSYRKESLSTGKRQARIQHQTGTHECGSEASATNLRPACSTRRGECKDNRGETNQCCSRQSERAATNPNDGTPRAEPTPTQKSII
jgi:hypothetical protein